VIRNARSAATDFCSEFKPNRTAVKTSAIDPADLYTIEQHKNLIGCRFLG
jgi:hypothetical protein